ncbi:MAG: hypothetical protein QF473_25555 [Planctomycetota bacterium]|nr:hypothetical protein [Planctomycetota bacterium]
MKIALKDGKTFHAIINHESAGEVRLGNLKTKGRFATDYEDAD